MSEPVQLSYWKCESILRAEVLGRIAFSAPDGPHILPINYSVVDKAIIVRTSPDSLLSTQGCGVTVAFEVDYIKQAYRRGCSVVARGETEIVTDPAGVAHIHPGVGTTAGGRWPAALAPSTSVEGAERMPTGSQLGSAVGGAGTSD